MTPPVSTDKAILEPGFQLGVHPHALDSVVPRALTHRADVDGLRAVAIVPVVLFHLGVPGFGGGYVGVDVFFVISGFLITSILHAEMAGGRFSLVSFYERRIRRIFPALFAMLALTTLVALALLLPLDLKAFGQSVVATALFSANVLFWQTAGYFDGPAELKPLLHAWTLAVEEQFYIVYPPVLWLLVKWLPPRRTVIALVALGLASFTAGVVLLQSQPDSVFYLPHFRAWELLLGGLLAMPLPQLAISRIWRDALSLAGLAMIAYCVMAYSSETPFPGWHALLPCFGAALVIYAGQTGSSLGGRLLGRGPVAWVGLISYSLYLWHWPVIVFAKYWSIGELSVPTMAIVLAASVLLAAASWRFVERPFRGKRGILTRPVLFATSGAMIAAFVGFGLGAHLSHGYPGRVNESAARLASTESESDRFLEHCVDLPPERIAAGKLCQLGKVPAPGEGRFLFWGDSHGAVLASAFDKAASAAGKSGLFVGKYACPPLYGVERYDSSHACAQIADAVMRLVQRDHTIDTVVIAARWAFYATGSRYGAEGGRPVVIAAAGRDGNRAAMTQGLESTLRLLDERGVKVILVGQVPEVGWQVPSGLARAMQFGRSELVGATKADYRARQRPVDEIFSALSRRHKFQAIDLGAVLCPTDVCMVQRDGKPLYRDDDHLSAEGARVIAPSLEGRF